MEGTLVWLILARADGVGRVRLGKLMNACPDPQEAWQLSLSELMQVESVSRQAAESLVAIRRSSEAVRSAEQELLRARKAGLRLVAMPDLDYPVRLRLIPDPPPYFYQGGPWAPDARPVVAVVGTRKATPYGLAMAERFGRELAQAGAVVVSGMARGIDCAAHRGALAVGGTTLAILGGGADVCYPREEAALYRAIRASGAVISEQPPGAQPRPEHFPERNRIISGLANGIVVVEAGERSGTHLTVDSALRQGRDVFAVPGPVTSPMSIGPHLLIRDGAGLVTGGAQVLEALGYGDSIPEKITSIQGLARTEQQILGWIGPQPHSAGELAEASGIATGEVQAILTLLELRGLIRQLPGGQYTRIG